MPQIAAMTIADGQTTPANHTFTPDGIDKDGVTTYLDKGHGSPVSNYRITTKLRAPIPVSKTNPTGSGVFRHNTKVVVPKIATINGVEVKVGENYAHIEFVFAENSTEAERADVFAFTLNALQHPQVYTGIKVLERTW